MASSTDGRNFRTAVGLALTMAGRMVNCNALLIDLCYLVEIVAVSKSSIEVSFFGRLTAHPIGRDFKCVLSLDQWFYVFGQLELHLIAVPRRKVYFRRVLACVPGIEDSLILTHSEHDSNILREIRHTGMP
jgi:hypothetical protein